MISDNATCNVLLFNYIKPWFKMFENEDINVFMGCVDREEFCELVVLSF